MTATPQTILCISSYFKGNRFLQRAASEGHRVYLLTTEAKLAEGWRRDCCVDVFALPSFANIRGVINSVAYLFRTIPFQHIVALDDYDVELAATLNEHFRLPGMSISTARLFRDKLAMRARAATLHIPVPQFVGLHHHAAVSDFLHRVPPPWLIKPRAEASAMGIQKFHDAGQVWERIHQLGDDQSFFLLERFVDADIFHVDSLVADGKVAFAQVSAYHRPLLEVYQGGGIFATRTLSEDAPEVARLWTLNEQVLLGFGMINGASHTEFLREKQSGDFLFMETSARVGGALITDMVEAASGVNVWEEWASLMLAEPGSWRLPTIRHDFAGAVVSLARDEWPDHSSFQEVEIVHRMSLKYHLGFVVRSGNPQRILDLLAQYVERISRDFHAVLPPSDRPTN